MEGRAPFPLAKACVGSKVLPAQTPCTPLPGAVNGDNNGEDPTLGPETRKAGAPGGFIR